MKAVMYHYVRGTTERPPDYYYLDVDDFRMQLDFFEENYGFVEYEEFLAALRGPLESPPSGIILTFDDGLRDHYEVVLPELRRRDLWGIFYVPTGPYTCGRLLDVHRIHILLGRISGERLFEMTSDVVEEYMIPHSRREAYREQTYNDHDDGQSTKQVKRILNYFISDEYQTEVLDRISQDADVDSVNVDDYYMSPSELYEMNESGMVLGGHTVTHPVLSKLGKDSQREEITECFDFLDEVIGGLRCRTFCFPYGKEYSFDENTIELLEEATCEWSFKVEPADIDWQDLKNRPQALPRYDCTDFPHGTASGEIGPMQ